MEICAQPVTPSMGVSRVLLMDTMSTMKVNVSDAQIRDASDATTPVMNVFKFSLQEGFVASATQTSTTVFNESNSVGDPGDRNDADPGARC